ncbi:MAG TPA: 16S rRNA (uracil(1498)-N(3))-methyltransferase [Lachnospiraceae bacterium]|nr:16S rRNA (uracil(1498)-N(3))-methyltransferase [Lachnospiraceae bacterium]
MYQFFAEKNQINGTDITITGEDVNHIKNVLRMKIGEELSVVTDGEELEYRCEIAAFEENKVRCRLRFIKEEGVELPNRICLFQGLPKNDKMELIVQKAVELGACEVIPVQTKRTVIKLDAKKEQTRITRWNAIAEAAAKQAKRRVIPQVKPVMTMKEAVDYCKEFEAKFIPYELSDKNDMDSTRALFKQIRPKQRIAVFIGPEGGFDESEISLAIENGLIPITLGRRILRTETAGFTVLAWLVYELEK